MDAGSSANNTRPYVGVSSLGMCAELKDSIRSIPGLHALTGIDYTCAFSRKGKVRPFQVMTKKTQFLKAFAELGESPTVSQETYSVIEEYVVTLYGSKAKNINEARYNLCCSKYKPKPSESPLHATRGADASTLPPCQRVLEQKIKRANLVSLIWKKANLRDPVGIHNPTNHGWTLENVEYCPLWYYGDQVPSELELVSSELYTDVDSDVENESSDDDDNAYEL